MSERPLLLSSAKIGVPLREEPHLTPSLLIALFAGLVFVLFGAADIVSRLYGEPLVAAAPSMPSAVIVEGDTHEQAPTTVPLSPMVPDRLVIASLGIDAAVERVGLNPRGNMAVPSGYSTVAWYKDGGRPGSPGNTVIAGHLNNSLGLSGVFERLNQLQIGDTIVVRGALGDAHYVVRDLTVYSVEDAPTKSIFTTEGPSNLVLITCDGAWDQGARSYDKRLVVVAEPV
jgi:LPXTG-site transpeptidase (sortase) family protein